jgi:hypothetical protein
MYKSSNYYKALKTLVDYSSMKFFAKLYLKTPELFQGKMFIFDIAFKTKICMKKSSLITLILVLLPAISNLAFSISSMDFQEKDRMEIVISRQTTKTELETMIKSLKKEGIDMSITEVIYSGKGTVRKISGEINFNDGHSGSFQATKLRTIRIVRDYNPEAEKPFDILFEN